MVKKLISALKSKSYILVIFILLAFANQITCRIKPERKELAVTKFGWCFDLFLNIFLILNKVSRQNNVDPCVDRL